MSIEEFREVCGKFKGEFDSKGKTPQAKLCLDGGGIVFRADNTFIESWNEEVGDWFVFHENEPIIHTVELMLLDQERCWCWYEITGNGYLGGGTIPDEKDSLEETMEKYLNFVRKTGYEQMRLF